MYGKIYAQLFESTINELELHVRFVWIALLVICDEDGIVDATPQSIARRINMPLEQVEGAIKELCSPDPWSRSPGEEGRRLLPIRETYGWRIVNFAAYRNMRDQNDRRTYMREYMRNRRATGKGKQVVSTSKQPSTKLAHTDTDTDTDTSLSSDVRRPKTKTFEEDSAPFELAALLLSLIRRRNPKHREPNLQKWALDIDRMIRRDSRTAAEIRGIIEWSQADSTPNAQGFCWANNILSPGKLRKQFDQLVLKSQAKRAPAASRIVTAPPPQIDAGPQ